jgi:glycosyltransferase involved in cell wall biosynthesis
MKISVIIPVFNEEAVVKKCLESLLKQKLKDYEILVVDDGSNDKTLEELLEFKTRKHIEILKQKHLGPGLARNLGAKQAKGGILVFVDADMEFEKNFLEKLVEPIKKGLAIGTFSKEEYLLNKENKWARFWNINLGRSPEKMHKDNYPNTQPVFRAISKSEFEKAGGFDIDIGYTDDWSLSRKLGVDAVNAPGAIFYHRNPESLREVWIQARWFGKNEFLTKTIVRKVFNLIRYDALFSLIKGIYLSIKIMDFNFLIFKITYDSAVSTSVLLSFFGEQKNK